MPPPEERLRRVDYLAASVANGMLTRKETMRDFQLLEATTGEDRREAFADVVYEIAQALQTRSELIP